MTPPPIASLLVTVGIPAVALVLLAFLTLGTLLAERRLGSAAPVARRRALFAFAGMGSWMLLIALVARTGVLSNFESRPPPMMGVFFGTLIVAVVAAASPFGKRLAEGLPLGALVGFQAFRLPLELVMHQAAAEGVMPSVMSWNGYNFDIVTGTAAAGLGLWFALGKPPRIAVVLFNLVGSVLLFVVSLVALLALPIFAVFGPDQLNLWVTRFPFTWMAVMVGGALLGHVLLARKLVASRMAPTGVGAAGAPGA